VWFAKACTQVEAAALLCRMIETYAKPSGRRLTLVG
jgi:hypothetical protein